MFELSRIPYFVAVAELGSFVKASEQLRITRSAVTTQIQKLERELSVQLFLRTTRQVKLTSAGSDFLEHCLAILEKCEFAQSEILGAQSEVSGTVRISATSDTGPLVLAPILAEFASKYPNVEVELLIADDDLDLVSNRLDFAIREGDLKTPNLKAIRLQDFKQWVICGTGYKAAIDAKNSLDALAKMRWATVTKVQSSRSWIFASSTSQRKKLNVSSSFQSNSTLAVLNWVKSCPGCAVLPDFVVSSQVEIGKISRLLPQMKLPAYKVHAVYLASTILPKRSRLLLDFIKLRLGK